MDPISVGSGFGAACFPRDLCYSLSIHEDCTVSEQHLEGSGKAMTAGFHALEL